MYQGATLRLYKTKASNSCPSLISWNLCFGIWVRSNNGAREVTRCVFQSSIDFSCLIEISISTGVNGHCVGFPKVATVSPQTVIHGPYSILTQPQVFPIIVASSKGALLLVQDYIQLQQLLHFEDYNIDYIISVGSALQELR